MADNKCGIIYCKTCEKALTTQDIFIGDGENCLSCNYKEE